MPFPVIPVIIGVGLIAAVAKTARRRDYGVMTEDRKKIYAAALAGTIKDPVKLRKLAAAFHAQGLFPQASMLDKRAALKERSPEVAAAHKSAFVRALASTNKEAILGVAQAFANNGATGAAAKLIQYAAGLQGDNGDVPDVPGEVSEAAEVSETVEPAEPAAPEEEPPPIRVSGTITEETTAPRVAESAALSEPAVNVSNTILAEGQAVQ